MAESYGRIGLILLPYSVLSAEKGGQVIHEQVTEGNLSLSSIIRYSNRETPYLAESLSQAESLSHDMNRGLDRRNCALT